jgi:general secretion pathway protein D
VQTVVTVPSGETFALGGLIQNTKSSGSTGVPLLSKIPLLGGLFGVQTLNDVRNELVLVITPTVVNDNSEARAVTDELRRKLPSLEGLIPKSNPVDTAK